MKTGVWIGSGVLLAIGLVVGALTAGGFIWGRQTWARTYTSVPGSRISPQIGCGGWGPGMMGWQGATPYGGVGCQGDLSYGTVPLSSTLTISQARQAVEAYLANLNYPDLEVAEVMEFADNFYAIAREPSTGIGAIELLVDKWTGTVGPEPGPNMMWNARYGMHARMMGGGSAINTLTPDQTQEIAQRWLDTYRPGVTVEDVDPFYGYYTVHTQRDGQIEGMLSVHGITGQVWYHTWHGQFIQMEER